MISIKNEKDVLEQKINTLKSEICVEQFKEKNSEIRKIERALDWESKRIIFSQSSALVPSSLSKLLNLFRIKSSYIRIRNLHLPN